MIGGYIIGAIVGAVVGLGIGVVMGLQHTDSQYIREAVKIPAGVAAFLFVLPWSFFVYSWTVTRMVRKASETASSPEVQV